MKLNVSPKELLALHNLLRDAAGGIPTKYNDHEDAPDDAQLRQLYGRVRAYMIASLSGKQQLADPLDSFMEHEKMKIERLRDNLDDVKKQQGDLVSILSNDKDFIVPQRGDDFEVPEYPRRSSRRGGGHSRPKK